MPRPPSSPAAHRQRRRPYAHQSSSSVQITVVDASPRCGSVAQWNTVAIAPEVSKALDVAVVPRMRRMPRLHEEEQRRRGRADDQPADQLAGCARKPQRRRALSRALPLATELLLDARPQVDVGRLGRERVGDEPAHLAERRQLEPVVLGERRLDLRALRRREARRRSSAAAVRASALPIFVSSLLQAAGVAALRYSINIACIFLRA